MCERVSSGRVCHGKLARFFRETYAFSPPLQDTRNTLEQAQVRDRLSARARLMNATTGRPPIRWHVFRTVVPPCLDLVSQSGVNHMPSPLCCRFACHNVACWTARARPATHNTHPPAVLPVLPTPIYPSIRTNPPAQIPCPGLVSNPPVPCCTPDLPPASAPPACPPHRT
jgi:hypothetical protein